MVTCRQILEYAVVLRKTKDSFLYFTSGEKFFDFSASLSASPFGYHDQPLLSAAKRTLPFSEGPRTRATSDKRARFFLRTFLTENKLDRTHRVFIFDEASGRQTLGQLESSGILTDPSDRDLFSASASENGGAVAITNRSLIFQSALAEKPKSLILRDFWPDLKAISGDHVWEHIFLYGLSFVGRRFPLILVSANPETWVRENESLDVDLGLLSSASDLYFSPKLVRRRKILEEKIQTTFSRSGIQNRFGQGLHWRLPEMPRREVQRRESFPDRFFYKDLTFMEREKSFYLGVPITIPFEHVEPKLASLRNFFSAETP